MAKKNKSIVALLTAQENVNAENSADHAPVVKVDETKVNVASETPAPEKTAKPEKSYSFIRALAIFILIRKIGAKMAFPSVPEFVQFFRNGIKITREEMFAAIAAAPLGENVGLEAGFPAILAANADDAAELHSCLGKRNSLHMATTPIRATQEKDRWANVAGELVVLSNPGSICYNRLGCGFADGGSPNMGAKNIRLANFYRVISEETGKSETAKASEMKAFFAQA